MPWHRNTRQNRVAGFPGVTFGALSTKNSFFVSNKRQARITALRPSMQSALSLLALPMVWGAVRVDASYARGGEYSGLPLDRRRYLVLARARRGPTTTPRESGEAQAGVGKFEGGGSQEGGKPFFDRAWCRAPCLAPARPTKSSRPEGAPRPEDDLTPGCDSKLDRSVEEGKRLTLDGQTKNSEGRLLA